MSLIMCSAGPSSLTASATTSLTVSWNLVGLGRGDPAEVQPAGFNTNVLQEILEDGEPPPGEQVASYIVAIARVSAS